MKKIILITLFIILLSTLVFATTPAYRVQKHKILIVLLDGKASYFKQTIIDSLMTTYDVEVMQGMKAKDIKANEFKAVVVMDQLKAWMMGNGKLKSYTKVLDPKHTVYFVTSGDAKWKWKKQGINAVSSPSKNANVGEVVKKLRDYINHETH